jgi:predicted nucleic acid-binding protein
MSKKVLDASVGVKWFLEEKYQRQALSILDRIFQNEIEAVVPEIFYLELANVFQKEVRKKVIKLKEAQENLENAMELPLKRHVHEDLFDIALDNALVFKISAYDALYLSLAEIYMAPLITADKELYKRCWRRFDFIEYLGDIKP